MIKLVNLKKNYQGLSAVDGISLEIPTNSIYGVIGKSGAGKSTLVRLISLLEQPDGGEIFFNERRVDNLKGVELLEQRWKLGMIFQNFNLFSSRNVFGNIAYPMEIVKKPKNIIKQRVEELLDLVDLTDKINVPVSKLSGGQKQRVAIARALANDPEILFCDEATSALDPQTTLSILELIKDIKKKIDLTVVMITHQMEVVREICDNVAVISEGRIVESGNVKDVFGFPRSDVTREFLSVLQPTYKKDSSVGNLSSRYRLHFLGDSAGQPVISMLIREFNLDINIISGAIQKVDDTSIGSLVVELNGETDRMRAAQIWLSEHGVRTEKIND